MMTELSFEAAGWWLLATIVASVLCALIYPFMRRWMDPLNPRLRSSVRLAYVVCAPTAALFSVIMVTQPTWVSRLVPAHCHGDFCGLHAPVYTSDSMMLVGLAAASSVGLLCLLCLLLWALRSGHRQLRLLHVFTHTNADGYRTLDSAALLAFCVGLWRPQIVLSRALVERLRADELAVVLAHERAHCDRYDNLRMLCARWSTLFWPKSLGHQVRADIRADAEQACDLYAVRTVADTSLVASTIRTLAQLPQRAETEQARSVGFDCDDVAGRLIALESAIGRKDSVLQQRLKALVGLSLHWSVLLCVLIVLSHGAIEWLGAVGSWVAA